VARWLRSPGGNTAPFQARHRPVSRVAVFSVHTSPLDQPGTGDAGGMNVYIVEVARRMAEAGVEVEIFTRATSSELPPVVEMAPGVEVRHIISCRGRWVGWPSSDGAYLSYIPRIRWQR
jgi:hypothetical protein